MGYLRENAITLLESTTSVNLNAAASTTLFTVPPGKTAWITHVVLRDLSADSQSAEVSLGESADTDDWMKKLLLGDHLDAADDALILRPRHWLQASDTWDPGSIVLSNSTGGAVDLASGTVRVRVWKYDDGFIEYAAGDAFTIEVTTAAGGACTCTADVFGYLA